MDTVSNTEWSSSHKLEYQLLELAKLRRIHDNDEEIQRLQRSNVILVQMDPARPRHERGNPLKPYKTRAGADRLRRLRFYTQLKGANKLLPHQKLQNLQRQKHDTTSDSGRMPANDDKDSYD